MTTNITKVMLGTAFCGLIFSANAMASPKPYMPHPHGMSVEFAVSQNAAMERMLTLRDDQKGAFKAYAKAREDVAQRFKALRSEISKKPPVDVQGRLEVRAKRSALMTDVFSNLAKSRLALLEVLDAPQKLVLETIESQHRFGPHKAHMKRGFHSGKMGMHPGMVNNCDAVRMHRNGPKKSAPAG